MGFIAGKELRDASSSPHLTDGQCPRKGCSEGLTSAGLVLYPEWFFKWMFLYKLAIYSIYILYLFKCVYAGLWHMRVPTEARRVLDSRSWSWRLLLRLLTGCLGLNCPEEQGALDCWAFPAQVQWVLKGEISFSAFIIKLWITYLLPVLVIPFLKNLLHICLRWGRECEYMRTGVPQSGQLWELVSPLVGEALSIGLSSLILAASAFTSGAILPVS